MLESMPGHWNDWLKKTGVALESWLKRIKWTKVFSLGRLLPLLISAGGLLVSFDSKKIAERAGSTSSEALQISKEALSLGHANREDLHRPSLLATLTKSKKGLILKPSNENVRIVEVGVYWPTFANPGGFVPFQSAWNAEEASLGKIDLSIHLEPALRWYKTLTKSKIAAHRFTLPLLVDLKYLAFGKPGRRLAKYLVEGAFVVGIKPERFSVWNIYYGQDVSFDDYPTPSEAHDLLAAEWEAKVQSAVDNINTIFAPEK